MQQTKSSYFSLFSLTMSNDDLQVKKQRRAKANDRERTRMQTLNSALGDNYNDDSHDDENHNDDNNYNDDSNYIPCHHYHHHL